MSPFALKCLFSTVLYQARTVRYVTVVFNLWHGELPVQVWQLVLGRSGIDMPSLPLKPVEIWVLRGKGGQKLGRGGLRGG